MAGHKSGRLLVDDGIPQTRCWRRLTRRFHLQQLKVDKGHQQNFKIDLLLVINRMDEMMVPLFAEGEQPATRSGDNILPPC